MTNWKDLLSFVLFQMIFLLVASALTSMSSGPLWMVGNICYVVAIFKLCTTLPAFALQIRHGKTLGKFLNSSEWVTAWRAGSELDRWRMKQALLLYIVYFLGTVILSAAVFLGTPVS